MLNLFRMESKPLGVERIKAFLEDNYVSIGYPGMGDLENISMEGLRDRLIATYHYSEDELTQHLQVVNLFVNTMQDGDYVLVRDGDWVHLGDLGDYFYYDIFDNADSGTCHRRGVTWLKSLPVTALNTAARAFLNEAGALIQYKGVLPIARMDLWITGSAPEQDENSGVQVDKETIAKALNILKEALSCDDAYRREQAAIAILQYVK